MYEVWYADGIYIGKYECDRLNVLVISLHLHYCLCFYNNVTSSDSVQVKIMDFLEVFFFYDYNIF